MLRVRSFWLAVGVVAYVSFDAVRASDGRGPAWLCLVGLPLALAAGWSVTAPKTRGEDRIEPGARSAARVCLTGAAILIAARSGLMNFEDALSPLPPRPAAGALANVGAALASMAGLVALARIAPLGGLLDPPASTRRLDAAAFASLLWTIAVALPAVLALSPERAALLDPMIVDYATVVAATGSLGIGIVAAMRVRALRRLELGIVDRASAALYIALTAVTVGVLASFVGVAAPERVLPETAIVSALAMSWAAITREPTAVSRALRVILTVSFLAAPIALGAVYVTHAAPGRAGPLVFFACVAVAIAGLATPLLARGLAPERHRWLDAFDGATRAAMNPDPDAALQSALGALRETIGRVPTAEKAGSPALYRITPAEVVTVDRAGFLHTQKAEAPARLLELAEEEPERILRIEVLRAVEVRRPEVRPLIAWLVHREIAVAAVVRDDEGTIGVLTLPRGGRSSRTTLEEIRALRTLSDRLGAVIGVSSSLARSRERELEARRELDRLVWEVARLGADLERDSARLEAIARILARPARIAAYSPTARAALEQLERLAVGNRPVTLLTAPGINAAAWAALTHLASARRGSVLVIVDGADGTEHDLLRWRDVASSPIRAAAGGTLVILDAQALPREIQSYLGAALPDELGTIVTVPSTIDSLVAAGRMDERLADRLGDRAVALPALASRSEDLRALALEHTSKIGVRLYGKPLGLDLSALAVLSEHSWPGNDAELEAILLRAALVTEGEVIGRRELDAVKFEPTSAPSPWMEDRPSPPPKARSGARRGRSSSAPSEGIVQPQRTSIVQRQQTPKAEPIPLAKEKRSRR